MKIRIGYYDYCTKVVEVDDKFKKILELANEGNYEESDKLFEELHNKVIFMINNPNVSQVFDEDTGDLVYEI